MNETIICEKCELKCRNKGKETMKELEKVPKWCPFPEIKYPDGRVGGVSVKDYGQL